MASPDPELPIVIIGAGPTGLGAAYRLHELGHTNFIVLEASPHIGGLSYTHKDPQGFLWDLGGHVIFSHYQYFDRAIEEALSPPPPAPGTPPAATSAWCTHQRESWVWMRGKFMPYPLQHNLRHLPPSELQACLDGLVDLTAAPPPPLPQDATFHDFLQAKFGAGLARVFMAPYNEKVWGYPLHTLGASWMGERVALPCLKRTLGNLVHARDDCGWGPNAHFRFPAAGGTGAIWAGMAARVLPPSRLRCSAEVVALHTASRTLTLASGCTLRYRALITTMPMDALLGRLADQPTLAPLAARFVHSSTHVVGVGLAGQPPPHLAGKCWMYFPEPDTPFYRVTVFSHYAPGNVPQPGAQWSLLCEVCDTAWRPAPGGGREGVVAAVLAGLRAVGLLEAQAPPPLSTFHTRLEYGYPTPWHGRDGVVGAVNAALQPLGIYSRGRFGGWKYEVANQDHSFMQGVEAVDCILTGAEETTFLYPDRVNAGKRPLAAPGAAAAGATGAQ